MYVVATAGHVDHGKSTLVRAVSGMEPDRWAEEKRRGLTIDLGFAWTELESGKSVAFVDVPGHERFLGNMLAGLGPVPVVCFVVAVDEGWQAQSRDHRDAVAALGIEHAIIVLTKVDRAPDRVDQVLAQVRHELRNTALTEAPAVAVSAQEGLGLDEFRATLDGVLSVLPAPVTDGRIRLWVDRAFSISGAGTVVTGTLATGTVRVGDKFTLMGRSGDQSVTVRSIQSHNASVDEVGPTNRVALNLRGISAQEIHRGDTVLTPDAWPTSAVMDIRRISGPSLRDAPVELLVHVGTATVPARLRDFDDHHARLTLEHPVPVCPGDRLVLRFPGGDVEIAGARVLDVDPVELSRRGDAARQAQWLRGLPDQGDARLETVRRGAMPLARLVRLGLLPENSATTNPQGAGDILVTDSHWIHRPALDRWSATLRAAVERELDRDELSAGLTRGAALDTLKLPDAAVLDTVIRAAGLELNDARLTIPGRTRGLGAAEHGVQRLETRLAKSPFDAPEAYDLADLKLGPKELAAAQKQGRLLRLADDVVLLPSAPALAMRELSRLEQPFTTSQARQAWGTTRRVAIPLLEHLDARGWTRRLDGSRREIAR